MLTAEQRKVNREFLDKARIMTADLLRDSPRGLGIDQIRYYCEAFLTPSHPTLWGAVVKDKRFVRNGDRRSESKRCHGRWIIVWKLV